MCNEYNELMRKAMDYELSEAEEAKLVAHLGTCEKCKAEYEQLQQLKKWLGQLGQEELPEGFHQELMRQIEKENKPVQVIRTDRKHKIKAWQACGVAACLMIVCVSCFKFLGDGFFAGKSEFTQMADVQSETTQEEGAAAMPATGKATDNDSSVMVRMQDASEAEQAAGEASGETWQVSVEDVQDFMKKTAEYLSEQDYVFATGTDEIHVEAEGRKDELYLWLTKHQAEVSQIDADGSSEQVCLQFKEKS